MENLFTTCSENYEDLSNDKLREKLYNLFKIIPENTERNGFIVMPDVDGFKVYKIEEKTLKGLLNMVDFVRRNQTTNYFESIEPIKMELELTDSKDLIGLGSFLNN